MATENITIVSEDSNITITQTVESIEIVQEVHNVTVAGTGMRGPQGIQGPPGVDDDKHYAHDQMIASSTWTIMHNMNKYPSVTVVTSAGDEVEGDVNYTSANALVLSFSAAFAGKAYLN